MTMMTVVSRTPPVAAVTAMTTSRKGAEMMMSVKRINALSSQPP